MIKKEKKQVVKHRNGTKGEKNIKMQNRRKHRRNCNVKKEIVNERGTLMLLLLLLT